MQFLTVAACLDCIHHDILRSHKWQLCQKMFLDNLWIYYQTIYHVQVQIQDSVDG